MCKHITTYIAYKMSVVSFSSIFSYFNVTLHSVLLRILMYSVMNIRTSCATWSIVFPSVPSKVHPSLHPTMTTNNQNLEKSSRYLDIEIQLEAVNFEVHDLYQELREHVRRFGTESSCNGGAYNFADTPEAHVTCTMKTLLSEKESVEYELRKIIEHDKTKEKKPKGLFRDFDVETLRKDKGIIDRPYLPCGAAVDDSNDICPASEPQTGQSSNQPSTLQGSDSPKRRHSMALTEIFERTAALRYVFSQREAIQTMIARLASIPGNDRKNRSSPGSNEDSSCATEADVIRVFTPTYWDVVVKLSDKLHKRTSLQNELQVLIESDPAKHSENVKHVEEVVNAVSPSQPSVESVASDGTDNSEIGYLDKRLQELRVASLENTVKCNRRANSADNKKPEERYVSGKSSLHTGKRNNRKVAWQSPVKDPEPLQDPEEENEELNELRAPQAASHVDDRLQRISNEVIPKRARLKQALAQHFLGCTSKELKKNVGKFKDCSFVRDNGSP